MTNLQLLLSIGIPSFLVVLSWISNNARFTALEAQIAASENRLDARISAVESRLDAQITAVESRLNARISTVERSLDEAILSQHSDSLEILRNMASLHERVALVEARQ
jgi:hypothetical protein